jgi:hypothetical protein
VTFKVHRQDADPATALREVAERVVAACLAAPRATVTFACAVSAITDGRLSVALLAHAGGTDQVEFELRPETSVVHLSAPSGEVTWLPMPRPATGFVTAGAEGVGGLGVRARMHAGEPAGTTFEVPDVAEATSIAIEVGGWLSDGLPDEPEPTPFAVRTGETPIPR